MNQMGKEENTAGKPNGCKEIWFPSNRKTLFTALKPIRTKRRQQPSCRLMTRAAKQRWNVKNNKCLDTQSATCRNYVSDKSTVTEER